MGKGQRYSFLPCTLSSLVILAACTVSNHCYSQQISNVDFEVVGNTVRINYDIAACSDDETYDIKLLLGNNGELTEISRGLSGDIKDVPCGSSKFILWDVLSDRDALQGQVYFALDIQRIHQITREPEVTQEDEPDFDRKAWARRSWRADKGYVGGSFGIFAPYENYSMTPYSPKQNGFFLNTTIGYLPSLLLGVSTTVYFYGAPKMENLRISLWKSWGVMIGPLVSLPIGNRIKFEFRPQVGYSMIFPHSAQSDLDSLDAKRSGIAYNISTGLRLNIGKRTCYMLNVEYLSAIRKDEDFEIEHDLGVVGASFGVAFRFY